MSRTRRFVTRSILAALVALAIAGAFRFGVVPQRFSPFAPLDLAQPDGWFLDLKIAALKRDAASCANTLKAPIIEAEAIPDQAYDKGCGWRNAVRVARAGGTAVGAGTLSCPMAAGLALWLEHEVKPIARRHLKSDVVRLKQLGTYACRNIKGSRTLSPFRSQHATANAIDISGFVLADGRTVTVLRHWNGVGPESDFLKDVHRAACRYFRVALGPAFNTAHADHFHYDRGAFTRCR